MFQHIHTDNIVCTTDHSMVRASAGEEIAPKNFAIRDKNIMIGR